jgi:hypothetical protein
MRRVRLVMTHFSGATLVQTYPYTLYSTPGIYYPTLLATATSPPSVADAP